MAEPNSNRMYVIIGIIVVVVALLFFFMSGGDDAAVDGTAPVDPAATTTAPAVDSDLDDAIEVEPATPATPAPNN